MFNNIAHNYDFLNHFLSFGIDFYWRRRAIRILKSVLEVHRPHAIFNSTLHLLDLATGTADLAIEARSMEPASIIGIDVAREMIARGEKKVSKKNLSHLIHLEIGDAENLKYHDDSFDAVMIGYGIRNFENPEKGLKEIYRVLAPGGVLMILEFSKPKSFPVKQLYHVYSKYLMPMIGRLFSKDKAAYKYLPESIQHFPEGDRFLSMLTQAGFQETIFKPLTFRVSSVYTGVKIV